MNSALDKLNLSGSRDHPKQPSGRWMVVWDELLPPKCYVQLLIPGASECDLICK